jgi:hypothetical protein
MITEIGRAKVSFGQGTAQGPRLEPVSWGRSGNLTQIAVDEYIHDGSNRDYIDALSDEKCAVLAVESRSKNTRKGTRPFSPGEVLRLAAEFGVAEDDLPSAVFFYDWNKRDPKHCTRVPLRRMFEDIDGTGSRDRMTQVFVKLFTAVGQVVNIGDAEKRQRQFEKLIEPAEASWVTRKKRIPAVEAVQSRTSSHEPPGGSTATPHWDVSAGPGARAAEAAVVGRWPRRRRTSSRRGTRLPARSFVRPEAYRPPRLPSASPLAPHP